MVNINIKSKSIPIDIENKIVSMAVKPGVYGELDNETRSFIKKNVSGVSNEQIDSIRASYTQDKIIFRHGKLQRLAKELYNLFTKTSIVELSHKYDFPPMAIARQFLLLKHGKNQVKHLLKNINEIPDEKLRNEIKFIENNKLDIYVTINQDTSQEYAALYEKRLGEFLTKHGVKFKTQEELSEEQSSEHGRPINTPDFLIQGELIINGRSIHWIDAKNFYGSNSWKVKHSIKKQTQKYIDEWGSGAVIFSLGFVENLYINENVHIFSIDRD
jgi:hypothetical protein